MKKGTIVLMTMVAAAVIALGFGFFVLRHRDNPPVPANSDQSNQPSPTPTPEPTATPEPDISASALAGWKTYTNDKHVFYLLYPPNLKVGAVSSNSVLGTYDAPVKGFHVGPLVLVVLKDKDLQTQAKEYFDSFYNAALNPQPAQGSEVPVGECKIDKITNSNVVSIKSVSCTGEGGAARYAYIAGQDYDVLVDGYSKGFDNADNGEFAATTDYAKILATFGFGKPPVATATPTPNPTPTVTPSPNPYEVPNATPTMPLFTINADDTHATPNHIMVPAGTIVEFTFNVATAGVYQGGLEFKSSVVNTGTILPGGSKTVSFTVNQSFEFTPYWPSSSVAKDYRIQVMVQ